MPKATAQAKGARLTKIMAAARRAAAPPIPKSWADQAAFWGVALLLFFPPFFRGLFSPTPGIN
ncbi:MAG: hypothetical protein AB1556_02140 [Bacillota bacterium]